MTNEKLGVLIGATFGLVFVLVNAGELPSGIGLTLRVLGLVAFLGLIGLLIGVRRETNLPAVDTPQQAMFGRSFWIVVAAEVAIGWAGLIVINGLLDTPKAGVAWIALVVGLHFVALAAVWREPSVGWLGAAIALCGAAGLLLAATGSSAASIATIAGVIPGALLLGGGWWAALSHPTRRDGRNSRGTIRKGTDARSNDRATGTD